jgi:hypothetical protein
MNDWDQWDRYKPRRQRSVSEWFGIALVVMLVIASLALLAGLVLFFIVMSNYGSNK